MSDRHGRYEEEPPQDVLHVWLKDPGLALVEANMGAWLKAHPCDCEGLLCECDA